MLTRIAIVTLAAALAASAANAQDAAQAGSVALPAAASASLHWTGRGQIRDGVPVCISSPTGRYQLVVGSSSGQGLVGQKAMDYVVTFEANGTTQTTSVSRANPTARFDGSVDPGRTCASGPNARIVVALDPTSALAANSGLYADQVTVAVEPR